MFSAVPCVFWSKVFSAGQVFCWGSRLKSNIIHHRYNTSSRWRCSEVKGDMPRYVCILTFCIIAGTALCPDKLVSKAYGLAGAAGPNGSNARAVHKLGEIGEGVSVGLISQDNARITHEAFKDSNGVSHAFSYDFSDENTYSPANHDTWVAGVVASRGGVNHPNDIGIAPGVDIHSAKICQEVTYLDELLDFAEAALETLVNDPNRRCRVIVTGIAVTPIVETDETTPDGNSQLTRLYDYYAYHHNVIFVNPAGKDYTNPTIFGDSYNGITTGGLVVTEPDVYLKVGSNSNTGPTVDGRRKPDVAAPSQNQTMPSGGSDTSWHEWTPADGATSLSTPHTAGVAALLLGLADDTSEPNDNRNEVIRAVIVNSTFPNINDSNGSPTNPADPNNTWNPDRGYGRIDALRAYELLDANQVTTDVNITQQKGWAYKTMVSKTERHSYFILGEKKHRLVLTVTWNRRINKSGSTYTEERVPKFNIDLTITDPNGRTLFSETDTLNNLEKVDLILPSDGIYEISLENTNTKKDRSYALAFELLAPIRGDFGEVDYIVDYLDLAVLEGEWLTVAPDLEADLFVDDANMVNMKDFAEFGNHWLEVDAAYYQ